jgi:predicted enzyme related to lactoylglutathione lyase
MAMHPIVHVEIPANDRQAAGAFYRTLFDWQVQDMPEMDYATFSAEGGPGGGFTTVGQMSEAGKVLVYVLTEDIDATLAKAESLGGTTLVPKTEIPGMGWFGVFSDPTGNQIGVYTNMGGMEMSNGQGS